MSLDEITMTLSDADGNVSVETLAASLGNALEMLKSVSANIVASDADVRWDVVRASMRSPLRLTLAPKVTVRGRANRSLGRKVIAACLQGVKEIEESPAAPAHFTEDALDAVKRLVKERKGALLVFSSNGKDKVAMTERAAQHIEEISAKARLYIDFSTVEGHLEIVSVHEKTSFFIWEILTNHRIQCFGSDEHFDRALSLLKQKPRVAITGRVHYRNHVPESIDVERFSVLPSSCELPQPKDIGPVNITDGLSSEEYVRRLRNA